jgi:hypothetical protein
MAKSANRNILIALFSVFIIAGFLSISCPYESQRDAYPTQYQQLDGQMADAYPSTYGQYSTVYADAYPKCSYLCSGNYPGYYAGRYRGMYETVVVTNPDPIEFEGYHFSNDWFDQYPARYGSYHYSLSNWW